MTALGGKLPLFILASWAKWGGELGVLKALGAVVALATLSGQSPPTPDAEGPVVNGKGHHAMQGEAIWLLARGEVDGLPLMIRARDPQHLNVDPARSHIVIVSLGYGDGGSQQLPSDDDYKRIEALEAIVFERPRGHAELVFVETGMGAVRYHAYTSDVEGTLAAIREKSAPFKILDWDSAEDPEWQFYQNRVANLSGG